MCISVGTVEGKAEATRWRKLSFVSVISLCYRGPTLEYDSGVFFCVVFSVEYVPYMWLRWSFPVDGRIQIRKGASGNTPPPKTKQNVFTLRRGDPLCFLSPVGLGYLSERFAKQRMRADTCVLDYTCFVIPSFSCEGGVSLR